jgi:gamma-glutamyltranspeptidase/glutathione hydrolase
LAETLQLIAQEGVKTFYTGELADRMVEEIQRHGGILTAADLAAYEAIVRSPISIPFGDWQVVTNPAPAIGGACLAGMLRLLDDPSLKASDPMTVKRVAEVQKFILDYRHQHLETANDIEAEVKELLNKVANSANGLTSPSTIHCSAVDSNGLACAITASAGYGSGVMISGTGLWLNNSLGEIELHPHGLENFLPGTRLSSNMAPTIARRDDGTVMAIGSPGASRITTAIAQVLFNFVRLGMSLAEAIDYSRLHVEIFEDAPTISYEPGLNVDAISGFKLRQFPEKFMYFGGVHAALWNPQTGLSEVADPRRGGGMARGGL